MSRKISGSFILQPAPSKYIDLAPGQCLSTHAKGPPSSEETNLDTALPYYTRADDDATHASAYRATQRRQRDETVALRRAETVARMEEVLAWTLYRKMEGGNKMQQNVHNRKEIEKWFRTTTRDHPDGHDRVKAEDLVDTLISLGMAQTKEQVQHVFAKLKSRADSNGMLDQTAFCDALEKDFKIKPKTNFGLEDGEEGANTETEILQIPTRLALHRRHVIMSALRSHSVLDEDIGQEDTNSKTSNVNELKEAISSKRSNNARQRRTARALQQAPSWLLQYNLHEANTVGISDIGSDSSVSGSETGNTPGQLYLQNKDGSNAENNEASKEIMASKYRQKSLASLSAQGHYLLEQARRAQTRELMMAPRSKDYDIMGMRWKQIHKDLNPKALPVHRATLDKGWTPFPKKSGPRPGPPLKLPKHDGHCIRKDFPKAPEELQRYQKMTMRRIRLAREKQERADSKKRILQSKKTNPPRLQVCVHTFNTAVPKLHPIVMNECINKDAKIFERRLLLNDARSWQSIFA